MLVWRRCQIIRSSGYDTTSAALGGTMSNQAIQALPLNGRNFIRLLELRPGVVTIPGLSSASSSSNGRRLGADVILIEGITQLVEEESTRTQASPRLRGPAATRLKASIFTSRAQRIRSEVSLFRRPVKPNRNACTQGLRNVLADGCLLLPTVDVAVDLLRIAHTRIMALTSEPHYPIFTA